MAAGKSKSFAGTREGRIRRLSLSGVLSALVFVVTAYLHVPTYNGYVHFGDGFIFLAACILPLPYAVFVGASGAMLADLLTGFAVWAPGSMLIKALIALLFSCKGRRIITLWNSLMLLPAAVISALGYYLYEGLITGSLVASLAGIPGSLLQAAVSSAVFVAVGLTMDRLNIKKRILGGY